MRRETSEVITKIRSHTDALENQRRIEEENARKLLPVLGCNPPWMLNVKSCAKKLAKNTTIIAMASWLSLLHETSFKKYQRLEIFDLIQFLEDLTTFAAKYLKKIEDSFFLECHAR